MTFRTGSRRSCRLRLHSGARSYASMQNWVRLSSSGWYLCLEDVLADPAMQDVLGADSCWQFAVEDWCRRRPHRLSWTAHRIWREEENELAAEQARLIAMSTPLRTLRPLADRD
jgi:hypothetical protein